MVCWPAFKSLITRAHELRLPRMPVDLKRLLSLKFISRAGNKKKVPAFNPDLNQVITDEDECDVIFDANFECGNLH